jgi:HSP20 family protein
MLLESMDPFLAELDRLSKYALGASGLSFPMDVVRRGDEVVCHFDLPGADPDSIDVTLDGDTLVVHASRTIEYADGEQLLVSERGSGQITRRVRLGDWADADRVSAAYADGVLTVTVPVAEAAKPRKVAVTRGNAVQETRSITAAE